ncbi:MULTISPECIES: hypothetical protein [Sphingobacterium]|uniref:hypothetical protein n=1 Tax=Sphingobacterium TaxID=28453 RepID=UPI0015520C5A|nr:MULTISPECIES: hypothetical protein [Sphingobacterium]MDM1295316.1 hypothetical protein [Sphingobacterium sp. N143]NPE45484.1 hypothetical protein [Sphingobacterium prati]
MNSTIIVRYKLLAERQKFDEWRERMDANSQLADGFLDKTDLPLNPKQPYHSVVLRFDNKANAQKWLCSATRKKLLQELERIAIERREILHEHDNFWFDISSKKTIKKWKQVVVSIIAVYPLTQVIPILVQLILTHLGISSTFVAGVLIGTIISICMVYFAMPLILKLFKGWLEID